MELKVEQKTVNIVDTYDFGKYLQDKLGINIEVIGGNNGSSILVNVKKGEIPSYYESKLSEFLSDGIINFDGHYRAIMTYLANEGFLREGTYIFSFSW